MITGNTELLAIYIEPPADVRSITQSYTVLCITVQNSVTVRLFRENSVFMTSDIINDDDMHTVEVIWRADEVLRESTEFIAQGLTKYNGDHDWACRISDTSSSLQTYIRGYIL